MQGLSCWVVCLSWLNRLRPGEGGDVDTSEQREKQLVREKLKASGVRQ